MRAEHAGEVRVVVAGRLSSCRAVAIMQPIERGDVARMVATVGSGATGQQRPRGDIALDIPQANGVAFPVQLAGR